MAEPYFQFKGFRVQHSAPGFKVGTDGVLLGAWARVKNGDKVLDIGTGTGLIALMVAQRARVELDAIEINPLSAQQAKRNFSNSPFSDLQVYNENVADFVRRNDSYDVIVCNPPFYSHDQPSKDVSIRMAKHTVTLKPGDLFSSASKMLKTDGSFSVIFPKTEEKVFFSAAAESGFYLDEVVDVYPQPNYPVIRKLVRFVLSPKTEFLQGQLLIQKSAERHDYSDEYKELTKGFFLRF